MKKPYTTPLMSDYELTDNILTNIEQTHQRQLNASKDLLIISKDFTKL